MGAGIYANIGSLNLANAMATEPSSEYKALVCIFLFGGNDSFNMLVPRGNTEYDLYADARKNLAVPQADILPVSANTSDGKQYGFHPSMPGVQSLFSKGQLAVAANVGALIEPTSQQAIQKKPLFCLHSCSPITASKISGWIPVTIPEHRLDGPAEWRIYWSPHKIASNYR